MHIKKKKGKLKRPDNKPVKKFKFIEKKKNKNINN